MRVPQVTSLIALIFTPLCASHFIILTPPPLGNNINNEDQSPCGGFSPSSSDNITDFHVEGDAIGLTSLHAQSYFAYRGLLGTSLSAPNWTVLIPTVEEFGLNSFCQPALSVPTSWAGSPGLLQVIQDAEDGVHYQHLCVTDAVDSTFFFPNPGNVAIHVLGPSLILSLGVRCFSDNEI
ncbi:uncharacterized protein PV07_00276 [Cladophialophora immunda]|uniref:Copper acquisition factor BIM1-like domain-containing protein n=1 Tax=Cladophialophora immunda TaxID=569365 RepID=A0A0D2DCI9_9EURO|nr:uncharacterized protein PV07_00276 [Cladophialophora immunda]KIW33424.1 hypothetical protein PV07_00276 [Cladophialophora immunda]